MIKPPLKIHVQNDPWLRNMGVYLTLESPDGRISIAEPVEMTTYEPGSMLPNSPSFVVEPSEMQVLMEALWAMGIRPSNIDEVNGSAAHLRDMRAIVADKLKIPEMLK